MYTYSFILYIRTPTSYSCELGRYESLSCNSGSKMVPIRWISIVLNIHTHFHMWVPLSKVLMRGWGLCLLLSQFEFWVQIRLNRLKSNCIELYIHVHSVLVPLPKCWRGSLLLPQFEFWNQTGLNRLESDYWIAYIVLLRVPVPSETQEGSGKIRAASHPIRISTLKWPQLVVFQLYWIVSKMVPITCILIVLDYTLVGISCNWAASPYFKIRNVNKLCILIV